MSARLPHHDVLVRLGVSKIDGIGVFAIRDIPAGSDVFPGDDAPLHWVEAAALAGLSTAERRFYEDFAVRRDGRYGCPASFNLLTPGWYLNRPPAGTAANVRAEQDCHMVAARDIAAGEELTVDYSSFSEA